MIAVTTQLLKQRLFWKIFFAFWITNIIILTLTSIVIINALESSRVQERHKALVEDVSLKIIHAYENHRLPVAGTAKHQYPQIAQPIFDKRHPIRIYDGNTIIFEHRSRRLETRERLTFTVTSHADKNYRVDTQPAKPPRFLLHAFHRVGIVQFVLIALASVIVGFFLSISITRPLNKLGALTQEYAESGDISFDPKLLKRADEIGDLAREFSSMTQKINTTFENQKNLLHNVSHELRAPLARLQAANALIEQSSEFKPNLVQRIEDDCHHMDRLIESVLELSRSRQTLLTNESVDITALLNECIDAVAFEYPEHIFDLQSEPALHILSNRSSLHQIIDNVLRNACKYSPTDSQVHTSVRCTRDNIHIAIRDHGPGIPESEIEKVTTEFYRGGNEMHAEGFGLGLSIVANAMKQLGGTLALANHPHGGLEVTLTFPNRSSTLI